MLGASDAHPVTKRKGIQAAKQQGLSRIDKPLLLQWMLQFSVSCRNAGTRQKIPLDTILADADSAYAPPRGAISCHGVADCPLYKGFAFVF